MFTTVQKTVHEIHDFFIFWLGEGRGTMSSGPPPIFVGKYLFFNRKVLILSYEFPP